VLYKCETGRLCITFRDLKKLSPPSFAVNQDGADASANVKPLLLWLYRQHARSQARLCIGARAKTLLEFSHDEALADNARCPFGNPA
jgi:hypothetical protein